MPPSRTQSLSRWIQMDSKRSEAVLQKIEQFTAHLQAEFGTTPQESRRPSLALSTGSTYLQADCTEDTAQRLAAAEQQVVDQQQEIDMLRTQLTSRVIEVAALKDAFQAEKVSNGHVAPSRSIARQQGRDNEDCTAGDRTSNESNSIADVKHKSISRALHQTDSVGDQAGVDQTRIDFVKRQYLNVQNENCQSIHDQRRSNESIADYYLKLQDAIRRSEKATQQATLVQLRESAKMNCQTKASLCASLKTSPWRRSTVTAVVGPPVASWKA